ncbi:ATP-binding protein [Parafannyhessea umbonata]|uniref:ATP-binding protein n=1 Tax=Parafannyhessea umbonata TaxID=604330 RepID=UPI003D793502
MPQTSSERGVAQASFRDAARALFISGDTIAAFLASATPGQVAACTSMLESEAAHRDGTRRARLPGQARFPVPKSVEGFDWPNVSFPDGWGREDMCSLAFVRDAEGLVSCGQTGRGKTRMATALGIAATSAGYPAGFWQTAQLAPRPGRAKREGALDRLLADVAKARLLVLDEFGHVPFDVDGARLPCQAMSESHGRRSVISATNVGSGRWGTVFADDKLAAAIAGRVVHHGRLVEFGGPSHRLEESLMLGRSGR